MEKNIENKRFSSFELLRLVAMFGIVLHHLVIKGASTCGYVTPYDSEKDGIAGLIINSFVVGGVNCFVLITGWFGIKKPLKGFLKVFSETVMFGIISYILVAICESDFSLKYLFDSVNFRNNWFVNSYLMLLLFAPIIEKSLANIQYSELKRWIILLGVFNVVFVFLFRNLNDNGYNVIQFVFLYYIARFLRLGYDKKWSATLSKYSFVIYITMVSLLSMGFYGMSVYGKSMKSIVWFGYNQPLVLILSIAFFLMFAKLRFSSSFINTVSKGVFGVFVLHTTIHLIPIRNELAHTVYVEYGYLGIFTLAIIIYTICLAIAIPCSNMISKIISTIYTNMNRCLQHNIQ